MKVEFKGGRQLEQALRNLNITTARKRGIARRALDEAAKPIQQEWQRGVDVDEGDLKRSIKVGNRAQTKATRKFRRGSGQDMVERYIGIDTSEDDRNRLGIYAYVEEFGDQDHAANPAGRNAWEGQKMNALNTIREALGNEIEKVAKAEAKKAAK